ncbi:MAG: hypothetical protein EB038_05770, partial [Cyclobacteriaceae bacterium]|nr:hypothetical protein [Cyclobacteriaceae bacterium]
DFSKPFYRDFILPAGNLREFSFGKKRAQILIVTKCYVLSSYWTISKAVSVLLPIGNPICLDTQWACKITES